MSGHVHGRLITAALVEINQHCVATAWQAVATRCWLTSEAIWNSHSVNGDGVAFCEAVVSGYFRDLPRPPDDTLSMVMVSVGFL